MQTVTLIDVWNDLESQLLYSRIFEHWQGQFQAATNIHLYRVDLFSFDNSVS